jgi:hypothetical protein
MANWLGESATKAWADALYIRASRGFEAFWDEARGSYVDHIKNGVPQRAMSQAAGALGILSGLAPRERWQRIIQTITDMTNVIETRWMGDFTPGKPSEKMMKIMQGIYEPDWDAENQIVRMQPFMSYAVHDAVALAGEADRLPALCRSWGRFFADGYDTIGENWGQGTHVHGWSCTPTKDMVFYTLGVTPAEPGYTKAHIAPRLGDLQWVEGKVPTPFGLISVRAESDKVVVDSPVPIVVELPGKPAVELPAGKHTIA